MTTCAGDLYELLASRRSIRLFTAEDVPRATVERVLEAACTAPSAHDSRPWRFVVLDRGERRLQLLEAMEGRFRADLEASGRSKATIARLIRRSRRLLTGAPWLIVVCLDRPALMPQPDERRRGVEHTLGVQSVAIAGAFLLLAAHAEGLGACWMSAPLFAAEEARSSLGLPASWEPHGLVLLGYPAEHPGPREGRPVGAVTVWMENT